jgi:hypothetical protein
VKDERKKVALAQHNRGSNLFCFSSHHVRIYIHIYAFILLFFLPYFQQGAFLLTKSLFVSPSSSSSLSFAFKPFQGIPRPAGGRRGTPAGGTGTSGGLLRNSPRRPLDDDAPAPAPAVAPVEVIACARASPPFESGSHFVGGARAARIHENTNTPRDIINNKPGGKNLRVACKRRAKLMARLAAMIAPIEKAIAG